MRLKHILTLNEPNSLFCWRLCRKRLSPSFHRTKCGSEFTLALFAKFFEGISGLVYVFGVPNRIHGFLTPASSGVSEKRTYVVVSNVISICITTLTCRCFISSLQTLLDLCPACSTVKYHILSCAVTRKFNFWFRVIESINRGLSFSDLSSCTYFVRELVSR